MLESYFSIAEAITLLFHPYAEVVIHDLKSGKIAAIFNNFSKRKVGDESLLEEFSAIANVFPPYLKTNWDGKKIKSITATLKDAQGKPIALFCINVDLSKFDDVKFFLDSWLKTEEQPDTLFKSDWREKINTYVANYLAKENISLSALSKEKKKKLIYLLKSEGAFEAKNAAAYIARVLNISRATIYNYLSEKES